MLAISIPLHWILRICRLLPLSKVITRTTISSSLRINADISLFCRLLEVERDLCSRSPRRHVVRSAECRQKVIEHVVVGDVDGGQGQVHLVTFLMEDVVLADREIEQVAWRNAWWVFVVILGSRRGNADQ